jgi:hypothetical protein
VPYKVVAGQNDVAPSRCRASVHAARDLGDDPAEDEADRRGLPRPPRHQGRHHGAGLLQRLPAPGHQGRRQDRRPRGAAHHQRAHRGRARLRPRQEEGREDRRVRPRRRHVRHLDPRALRRRRHAPVRGEVHQRRHAPRRRRLRPARHRLARGRVQEGPGHRPVQGPDGAAAPQGSRREGQDGAVERHADTTSTCPSSPPTSRARSTSTTSSRAPSSSSWWTTSCSARSSP